MKGPQNRPTTGRILWGSFFSGQMPVFLRNVFPKEMASVHLAQILDSDVLPLPKKAAPVKRRV